MYPTTRSTTITSSTALAQIAPYTPSYSDVLISQADVDMATLALNFGDKYRESYCTPRTFTLDLTDGIDATTNNGRYYMVMVLRAEGKEVHQYR